MHRQTSSYPPPFSMIGVLGGMGPLATVDFLHKLCLLTPAIADQQHIPVIVHSDPRVPERSSAITDASVPSPLPALLHGIANLERAGACCIVVICNTAHHWYSLLQQQTHLPILNMIEIACVAASGVLAKGETVGILATIGTTRSGLYQQQLQRRGLPWLVLNEDAAVADLEPAIAAVKAGRPEEGVSSFARAVETIVREGARVVMLGCTELPILATLLREQQQPSGIRFIDPTTALAKECVRWWFSWSHSTGGRKDTLE